MGAHLLEQVIHAILVQKQRDHRCIPCGKNGRAFVTHAEVFDFEPVFGVSDEWRAAQVHVQDLLPQLDHWVKIIRKAGGRWFETACQVRRPFLDQIDGNLDEAKKERHPGFNRVQSVGYFQRR